MKYRLLGKTNLRISVVGIGTWQLGEEWGQNYPQAEVDVMLDKAREMGVNLIDSAECFGDHLAESQVGRAIARDREKWVISTKFGHKYFGCQNRQAQFEPQQVQQQLEDSLRALKTDYIDLYHFHSTGNEVFSNDELWAMLHKQIQAGKIRHLGLSLPVTRDSAQVEKGARDYGIEAVQVVYNRLYQEPEDGIFAVCEKYNLGVMTKAPLASGYLTGKYKLGDFLEISRADSARAAVDEILQLVQRFQIEEVPEGVPMWEWAIAWCLLNPCVSCAIPDCKNVDHVNGNAGAANLEMVSASHPLAVE